MEDLITYITNDARCLLAIEELEAGMDKQTWLGEYLELYQNVTSEPEGLPRITNFNYKGEVYEGIQRFAVLYIETHHGHKDPFTDPFCDF